MEPALETIRSWLRWRAEKRSSVLGWIGVFAGQGLAGVVLYAAFLFLMGAPFNAATIYAGAFFAVGCAISGVAFGMIWAILFTQIIGIAMGVSVGVWFNLPSWWEAASTEWGNGASVPLLVVVLGLVLPPLWSLSCFIVHKGWIKVIDMILSRLMASITGRPSEADRRKAAAKDLKVSDTEADRAMRETETEPEGLTVINKSRIVREEQAGDEPEPEGESLYGSLAVEGNDAELDGLSESAAKSKQVVDASGAVISGEPEIKTAKPTFTDDFSSPFENQAAPAPAAKSKPQEEAPERLRSEDRNRLIFVTDDYNVMMTQSSNENDALLDFMERHTSTLLGLTDQEIAFLRSLPDGAGLGVAEAAMQIQMNTSDMDTSFEDMVSAGLDEDEIIAARPTAEVSEEDDDGFDVRSLYEDLDVSDGGAEESPEKDDVSPTEEAATSPVDDFTPDFSFSGDDAAKSLSGRRVASLLSAAAFGPAGDRSQGFESDDDQETDEQETDEEGVVLSEGDTAPASTDAAPSVSSDRSIDPVARKMELIQGGMSFREATAAVEREQAESGAEPDGEDPDEARAAETLGGEGEVPSMTDGDAASDVSAPDGGSSATEGDEASDEIFGFEVDPSVDGASAGDETGVTGDGEETHAAEDVGGDETAKYGEADGTSDEEQEDTDMSIEVPLSWEQASAIFKTMNDTNLMPEGKYEALMRIEKIEGNIDTVSAYRSKALIEHFGEKPAHDLKNQIIALFRDFKDSEAAKFGELASEAEAKIADMRQFPHKIDSSKLNLLATSASQMDALLKGNPSNMGMERKIRLSRIRADIENLKDLLESQTTPPVRKSAAASEEGRRKAEDMIKSLSGHDVSVSTAQDDDAEGEEVDMAAVAADDGEDEDMVQGPFADKPWLDPELGDLDEEFVLVPEGLDINTSQGAATLQERTALLARRVKAKEARDAFEETEKAARAEREAEEGEERARVIKASEIAQKEENLVEREDDLARREADLAERLRDLTREREEDAKVLAEQRRTIEEEQTRLGERGKVLDRLSDVFKGDAEKKVEIVRFVSDNMSGLFSVREVPERFAQVNGMFMDLALARAIQKRVKGSSVGLQDALMSEGSEGLPERIFPNKLNMAFHGATVFRKSAEIVHKLATELEVEVSVPNAFEEEVDVQALMDACTSEDEKAFVADISNWMKSSRTEFFEMTKAMEDNVHDYRLARKIESSNVQDVEELAAANVQLKKELEARNGELVEVRAALKLAESKRPIANATTETVEGYVDSGTAAMEIHEMFDKEDFTAPRGKGLREVGQRKVAIGLLDGNSGLPSKKKIMAELEAGSSLPVVIFTNAPDDEQEDISNHLAEFAQVTISFQPLDPDVARDFMLEEIRKIENE
ncbi:hypothetical protein [uncultured Salinicola sp.]|uniref:hypothetical protein n=1 Tax=uncultured Salinicola sp. TaxID=1193542 RepID=UPI0026072E3E|nr:hypothetical protein [uncultured Salinicola sp.]